MLCREPQFKSVVVLYRNKADPDDMHKEDVYMAAEESEAGRADMKVSLELCDLFCGYGLCQQGQRVLGAYSGRCVDKRGRLKPSLQEKRRKEMDGKIHGNLPQM